MQNYSYFVCFHNKLKRIYSIIDNFLLLFSQKRIEFYNIQFKKIVLKYTIHTLKLSNK